MMPILSACLITFLSCPVQTHLALTSGAIAYAPVKAGGSVAKAMQEWEGQQTSPGHAQQVTCLFECSVQADLHLVMPTFLSRIYP